MKRIIKIGRLNWAMSLVLISGSVGNVFATETTEEGTQTERSSVDSSRIYYKLPNNDILSFPTSTIRTRLGSMGLRSSLMADPLEDYWTEVKIGRSEETAMPLEINPKLAKKYLH